ncbi:unnamed protein product [Linum trigynum]|uniref:Secreted protein n=1 Tax=Linum trigynum TaxID=586398 RepID=A0AAV2FW07_9ROSI
MASSALSLPVRGLVLLPNTAMSLLFHAPAAVHLPSPTAITQNPPSSAPNSPPNRFPAHRRHIDVATGLSDSAPPPLLLSTPSTSST